MVPCECQNGSAYVLRRDGVRLALLNRSTLVDVLPVVVLGGGVGPRELSAISAHFTRRHASRCRDDVRTSPSSLKRSCSLALAILSRSSRFSMVGILRLRRARASQHAHFKASRLSLRTQIRCSPRRARRVYAIKDLVEVLDTGLAESLQSRHVGAELVRDEAGDETGQRSCFTGEDRSSSARQQGTAVSSARQQGTVSSGLTVPGREGSDQDLDEPRLGSLRLSLGLFNQLFAKDANNDRLGDLCWR